MNFCRKKSLFLVLRNVLIDSDRPVIQHGVQIHIKEDWHWVPSTLQQVIHHHQYENIFLFSQFLI
jgi:hypothetical protein